jgi:hypothetical protein
MTPESALQLSRCAVQHRGRALRHVRRCGVAGVAAAGALPHGVFAWMPSAASGVHGRL